MTDPSCAFEFTDLIDRYDALILDVYGVLVDLSGALPGAVGWIDALNRAGKPYWLASNTAARLPESAARRYQAFGLDIPAERILSAGMLLRPHFDAHGLAGSRVRVLGPEDSETYVTRAGGRIAAPGEDFDVLVVADQAGFPFVDSLDEILSRLVGAFDAGRRLPMLLPNPDRIYPTGRGIGFTAGAIADLIEGVLAQRYPGQDGLRFTRLGKPHPGLFEEVVRRAGSRHLLMVGDQLETDILGAFWFGIDSALVPGLLTGAKRSLGGVAPTYVLTRGDG